MFRNFKKRLKWYLGRAQAMGIKEIIFRFCELALELFDLVRFSLVSTKYKYRSLNLKNQTLTQYIHDNKVDIHKTIPEKNYSGKITASSTYYRLQNYRDMELRYHWEGLRFNDVLRHALNGDERSVEYILKKFEKDHPILRTEAYVSVMECAIRVINLYAALCILSKNNRISYELRTIAFKFFYINSVLITHRISKYSSRGNHTLFEYAGAAVAFTALGQENKTKKYAKLFWSEFDHQVNIDGSGVEQSTAYHAFNVDLATYFSRFISSNEDASTKLDASNEFLSLCTTASGNLVRFGDSDDSRLFTRVSQKSQSYSPQSTQLEVFDRMGFIVAVCGRWRIFLKYGGLGAAPLFAHGHYDFLSATVLLDGEILTADAQTYLYRHRNRKLIRSSAMHSMPSFGIDDIRQVSEFMWDRDGSGTLENYGISDTAIEFLTKYSRQDGVDIYRKVTICDGLVTFYDYCKKDSIFQRGIKTNWIIPTNFPPNVDFSMVNLDHNRDCRIEELPIAYSYKYGNLEDNRFLSKSNLENSTFGIMTSFTLS